MSNIKHIAALLLVFLLSSCEINENTQNDNATQTQDKIAFWNSNRNGTNIFNTSISREDIRAAKSYGIQFVRICFDKFPSKRRDFLIGNADHYTALDPEDLASIKQTLDLFSEEKMPVVITMLSLPGSRWNQLNSGRDDLRIWKDSKFQQQAARFWRDLATELRGYQIVIGYNILNEPHPERLFDSKSCHIDNVSQAEVQKLLFEFNNSIVRSIREVDKCVPIIIDSSSYADPNTFKDLQPINAPYILYSFHMYEPYEYTNHKRNAGKYSYPGDIDGKRWDRAALKRYMSSVIVFQTKHNIPPQRILVGEYGCYRKQKGLPLYFIDLASIFEKNHWHYAFYAFRENSWDGMDYELGDKPLPWEYWKAQARGEDFPLSSLRRSTYPQFSSLFPKAETPENMW
jgi:hypothetical protein